MYSITYRDIEVITNVNMARNFSFHIQFSSFCPYYVRRKSAIERHISSTFIDRSERSCVRKLISTAQKDICQMKKKNSKWVNFTPYYCSKLK